MLSNDDLGGQVASSRQVGRITSDCLNLRHEAHMTCVFLAQHRHIIFKVYEDDLECCKYGYMSADTGFRCLIPGSAKFAGNRIL